jgi:hypothetical protein
MPVVSSQLDYARQQANGEFICRESHTLTDGTQIVIGPYRAASLAAAQALRDARPASLAGELQNREENLIFEFAKNGNDPDDYTRTELTLTQMRLRLLKRFLRNEMRLAWFLANYVTKFNANQIANFLGVPLAKGQAILNRANNLIALRVDVEADDALIEDLD